MSCLLIMKVKYEHILIGLASVKGWRTAKFLQSLATLMPGGGVEDADGRQFIHFQTGNHLRPEHDPLRIMANWLRNLPQPRCFDLASSQRQLAVGAQGNGNDPTLMMPAAARSAVAVLVAADTEQCAGQVGVRDRERTQLDDAGRPDWPRPPRSPGPRRSTIRSWTARPISSAFAPFVAQVGDQLVEKFFVGIIR